MNHSRNRKRKQPAGLGRGFGAVALAAAVLALMIALLIPETPEPAETVPTTAVPSPIPENPYSVGDFAYENGYLTCTAGNTALGVDVSSHQGEIDWQQVADAGMEFAMIRIGYRGYTSGGIYEDECARVNLPEAKNAGLEVGVYFYSQALTADEAAQEAAFCISFLEDFQIDMPVVFDWEYVSGEARTGSMDRSTLMECVESFCGAIEEAGYQPMVYFNPSIGETLLDLEQLQHYPWWLAMYTDQMDYPYAVDMWQYTHKGNVPGITGDTDINLLFTD